MVLSSSQWFGSEAVALPATASFITSYDTTTNASTYTLAASDFGSPTLASGKLIFTLSGRGGSATWNTPTAVTESGNALTLVAAQVSGYNGAAVYQLDDRDAGALGEVIFTFGADMGAIIVGLYMITGTTTNVAAMVATSTASPLSADLEIPALGAAVGVGETENAATATWVNLTEDYDTTNADTIGSGASVTDEDGSRPTVTCTWTSSASPALCLASWGPAAFPANTDNRHTRSGSVYTFSDCLLGGPGIKKIAISVQPYNGAAFTFTVTVDGKDATQIVSQGSHNYDYYSSIFYIDNVTASTGDIVVTCNDLVSGVIIGVYCITNAVAGTAYDTDTYQTTTAITSQAISLDIPAGGCAIACAANAGSPMGTSSVYGWTNLTEDYDRWEEAPYTRGSGASGYFTEEQSGLAITAAITGNTGINAGTNSMVGASWQAISDVTGTATFTEVVSSAVNASSYTFSSADIGTADAARVVVLYVNVWTDGTSAVSITGVTIGGVAATQQTTFIGHSSGGNRLDIWSLAVASGTSADIVITASTTCERCQVGIWDCKNIGVTAHDSDGAMTASATSLTNTLSCPANGVIIAGGYTIVSTVTYTNVTEDYDSHNPETVNYYSGASGEFDTDQVDRVITMTAGSTTQLKLVTASFGPA